MPRTEHLVLCGGVDGRRHADTKSLRLNLHGPSENVHFKIANMSDGLAANIPGSLLDLLEVAGYIYAADSAITRGGPSDEQMGKRWRRKLRFVIPVRRPDVWSSEPVLSALVETLNFLSDDDYEFEFQFLSRPPAFQSYLEFLDPEATQSSPDELLMFSGGLDSLAGAVELLAVHGKNVALVSHHSSSKIFAAQKYLVAQLRSRFGVNRILHVPVQANLKSGVNNERTHRTRSFLFATLGAVAARCFGKDRFCFFENGVMSLNLATGLTGRRRPSDPNHSSPGSGGISPRSDQCHRSSFPGRQSVHLADKIRYRRTNCGEWMRGFDPTHPKLHSSSRNDENAHTLRKMLAMHRSPLRHLGCSTGGS